MADFNKQPPKAPPEMNFRPGRGPRPGMFQKEKPKNSKETLKKLLLYFVNEKRMLTILILFVVLSVVCGVFAPSVQSTAIDKIADRNFDALPKTLIIMIVLYLLSAVCLLFQSQLSAKLSQSVVKKMREDLFSKIVTLPVKYLDFHSHGDIMSRMTNDVENISNTVSQSLSSLISGVLTVIGTVSMMIYYSPSLALLSCFTVVLTVIITKYLSKAMRKFFLKRQILLGKVNGHIEENITSYKTVVAYNRQNKVIEEFDKTSDELTKVGIKAEILGGSMGPVMNVVNNIGFVIIAAFGGLFAIKGYITIGVISAFIVYAKQFGRPINEIANLYGQIQTAIAGAERIFDIMDEKSEDKDGEKLVEDIKGVVKFENVNFSYVPEKQVLFDFNLEVYSGHKVALVGATGSGKTTVVNLLMRFYDVDSGKITVDGKDIKELSLDELRKNVAIVLQDTVLFSDSIRNNIKYSNENISNDEMIKASRMSNCDVMINRLTDGYDTALTESGQNLSQGQRQLISIARAFVANPKILILDEATSSVDTRTEKRIQDAMASLMKDRTSLIIAHRLSTVRDADLIVVMDNGRIIEIGNHNELIEKQGKYYELYMTQFAGKSI